MGNCILWGWENGPNWSMCEFSKSHCQMTVYFCKKPSDARILSITQWEWECSGWHHRAPCLCSVLARSGECNSWFLCHSYSLCNILSGTLPYEGLHATQHPRISRKRKCYAMFGVTKAYDKGKIWRVSDFNAYIRAGNQTKMCSSTMLFHPKDDFKSQACDSPDTKTSWFIRVT